MFQYPTFWWFYSIADQIHPKYSTKISKSIKMVGFVATGPQIDPMFWPRRSMETTPSLFICQRNCDWGSRKWPLAFGGWNQFGLRRMFGCFYGIVGTIKPITNSSGFSLFCLHESCNRHWKAVIARRNSFKIHRISCVRNNQSGTAAHFNQRTISIIKKWIGGEHFEFLFGNIRTISWKIQVFLQFMIFLKM